MSPQPARNAGDPSDSTTTGRWHRTRALVDLESLRRNVGLARRLAGEASLCAVVKSDAYGHGVRSVVPALMPLVDSFAVATLEEGEVVRMIARDHDIAVLSGFNHPSQLPRINALGLKPVIHQPEQVSWLGEHGGASAGCWLKVDTGMHRLGFSVEQVGPAFRALAEHCAAPPGLMSHFAVADVPSHPMNDEQQMRFLEVARQYDTVCSMANSAALAGMAVSRLDMVRAGLMLYGISPFADRFPGLGDLSPVMRFESRVIAVKTLPPGGRVGYGATWHAQTVRTLAIAGAGYGDGYPRIIGNRGHVLVSGRPAPVIGRVSMDTMALDVSECGPVAVGDPVELWGEHLDAAAVAAWADTIPYELLCRVSPRVPRIAIN